MLTTASPLNPNKQTRMCFSQPTHSQLGATAAMGVAKTSGVWLRVPARRIWAGSVGCGIGFAERRGLRYETIGVSPESRGPGGVGRRSHSAPAPRAGQCNSDIRACSANARATCYANLSRIPDALSACDENCLRAAGRLSLMYGLRAGDVHSGRPVGRPTGRSAVIHSCMLCVWYFTGARWCERLLAGGFLWFPQDGTRPFNVQDASGLCYSTAQKCAKALHGHPVL